MQALETLAKKGLKGSYHISAFSPLVSDTRIFDAMTKLGANAGMIGIDSGSDTMLESYRKPFRMKQVNKFMEMRKDFDLRFLWTFILGGPGETEKTLNKSLEFIDMLPNTDVAYIVFGVRIYRQTHLYEQALRENVIKKGESILKPVCYFSRLLDRNKIEQHLSDWQETRDNVLTEHVANSDSYRDLLKKLSELGEFKTGWENVPTMKKLLRRRSALGMGKTETRTTV